MAVAPDPIGKILDIIGLIPLGLVGKALKFVSTLRAAMKAFRALRKAEKAAEKAVEAAKAAVKTAGKAVDTAYRSGGKKMRELDRQKKQLKGYVDDQKNQIKNQVEKKRQALKEAEEDLARKKRAREEAGGYLKVGFKVIFETFVPTELLKSLGIFFTLVTVASTTRRSDQVADIRGVLNGPMDEGAEDVLVMLARGGEPVAAEVTETSGWFEFNDLDPGEYQLIFDLYPIFVRRVSLDGKDVELTLNPDGGNKLLVTIDRDGDVAGEPTLALLEVGDRSVEAYWLASPDAGGTVCYSGLDMTKDYILVHFGPSEYGFEVVTKGFPLERNAQCIEMSLPSSGTKGRIVGSENGYAIGGATVEFMPHKDGALVRDVNRFTTARVETDRNGYFEVGHLHPGSYRVEIKKDGFCPTTVAIELKESKILALEDLVLAPLPNPGSIEGRIVDRDCTGPVYVVVSDPQNLPIGYRTFTDAKGRFSLPHVPPGTYNVDVQGEKPGFTGIENVAVRRGAVSAVTVSLNPKRQPRRKSKKRR